MKLIKNALRPKTLNRLIILSIYALLLMNYSQPIYGTTDDKILAGFIDGSYTGEKELQTIFIQPIINFILFPFYYVFPTFGWYAFFQVGLVIITLSLVASALNSVKPILDSYFLVLSIFILSWQVPETTYTSAAILTFLLTILLIFLYFLNGEESKFKIAIVTILFTLSFYLRPEAVLGISVLMILPIIKHFKKIIKVVKSHLIVILVLILSLSSVNLILREFNDSQEWDTYNEWNSYRHQLQNRVSQDNLWKNLEKISWSPAEHNLFRSLSFGDPNTFNSQWIKPAFELSKSSTGLTGLINADANYTKNEAVKVLQEYQSEIFFLFLLSITLLIFFRTFQNLFFICLTWLQGLTILYFMTATLHAPERVVIPLFIGCTIVSIILILGQNSSKLSNFSFVNLAILGILLALIVTPGGFYNDYVDRKNEKVNSIQVKRVLSNFDEAYILLGSVGTEVNHLVNPYFSSNFEQDLKIITVGNWETFSPHWYKRNFKLGIESKNVYEDLISNPKVLWVTPEIPDTAYQVELYLREQNVNDFERRGVNTGLNEPNVYRFAPDLP